MKDYKVRAVVSAEVGDFTRGMSTVERKLQQSKKSFQEFGEGAQAQAAKLERVNEAAQSVADGMFKAGLVAAAGIAGMVKVVADFDRALSHYQAVAKSTEAETEAIGETAMAVGRRFGITATEAVGAAEALNKAGVSTADILGGGMHGALVLAASDNIAVADAAETAAIAMNQFKLKGSEVEHVADLLAAGSAEAVGDVTDLSWALRQVGLVASSSGFSIEETTGALAMFASVGLIGSDAGTSFKSMLMGLQGPTSVARKEMEKYGLSFYDANGNMKSVALIAEELKTKLGGLTDEQRKAAMTIIFGQDAVRAATELYNQGAAGVELWTDKVNQSGYAAELAEQKLDNLSGDFSKLNVAIQNGFIKAGTGANDVMRQLVQGATFLADAFGGIDAKTLNTALMITGVGTAIAIVTGAVVLGVPKLAAYRAAMESLGIASGKTAKLVTLASRALKGLTIVGAVVVGMELWNSSIKTGGTNAEEMTSALREAKTAMDLINGTEVQHMGLFGKMVDGGLGNTIEPFVKDIDEFKLKLDSLEGGFLNFGHLGTPDWGRFFTDMPLAGMEEFRAGLEKITDGMVTLAQGGDWATVQEQFQMMQREMKLTDQDMLQIIQQSPELQAQLRNLATMEGINIDEDMDLVALATGNLANQAAKAEPAVDEMAVALEEAGTNAAGAVEDMEALLELMFDLGLRTQSAMEAEDAFAASVADVRTHVQEQIEALAQKKIEAGMGEEAAYAAATAETVFSGALAGNSAAALANREQIYGMVDAYRDDITASIERGDANDVVTAKMRTNYDAMLAATTAMTGNKAEAEALTRELLGIPDNVSVDTWMADTAKRMAEETKSAMDRIPRELYTKITTERATVYTSSGEARSQGATRVGMPTSAYAFGGPVTGGVPGRDSVPILAMPGEHVWTTAEVDAAGGHDAMMAMRRAVLKGGTASADRLQYGASGRDYVPSSGAAGGGASVVALAAEDRALLRGVAALADRPVHVVGNIDGKPLFEWTQNAPRQYRAGRRG